MPTCVGGVIKIVLAMVPCLMRVNAQQVVMESTIVFIYRVTS